MKSYWYWQSKGLEQIRQMEAHAERYHESIFDIPQYCALFFYVLMTLITPKRERKTKTKDAKEI